MDHSCSNLGNHLGDKTAVIISTVPHFGGPDKNAHV